MAIVRARNPLRWLRWTLFVLGVMGVLAVTVLVAAYQFGNAGQGEEQARLPAAARTDERTITAGEGFSYTQTSEGRPIFSIHAARSRQDREDMAFLETVDLEIFRDDGETYKVSSERAQVNQASWAADLEGDVRITGWGELELEARALRLEHGGQVLTSVGAVEFR